MKKQITKKVSVKTTAVKKGKIELAGIPASFNIVTKVSINGNTITFENQQLNFDGDGKLTSKMYAQPSTIKINTALSPF